jgi:PAS domain S-box-containing protein
MQKKKNPAKKTPPKPKTAKKATALRAASLSSNDPHAIVASLLESKQFLSESLHAAEERRRWAETVIAAMGDAMSIQDRQYKVLYQNQAHVDLIGSHAGEYCYRAYQGRDLVCDGCPLSMSFDDGMSHTAERTNAKLPGGLHIEVTASPLRDSTGTVVAGIEVVRNVTSRWRAEQSLRDERNFVNAVLDTVASLVLVLDAEGRIVRFNRACEELTGYPFEEVRGKQVWDLFILPGEIEGVKGVFKNLRSGMFPNRHVNFWRTRDGNRRLISWSNTVLLNDAGGVQYVIPTGTDITDQRRMEESLATEKERLAVTLRSIGDGVITTDTAGRVVLVNKAAELLTGWPQQEALGKPLGSVFTIVHEKTRKPLTAPIEQVLSTGRIAELTNHTVLISRDSTERIIEDSAAPITDASGATIGVVLAFRDVTEKKIVESERAKAERVESIGVLAGGIAHDYNNLLTAILGNINLARSLVQRSETEKAAARLAEAERASLRAKDLTRQLLTFSKGGAPVKKAASIAELIRESAFFALRGTNVEAVFTIPADLWTLEVDEGQMSQVINNLIINAVQAMPGGGGTIQVRAGNVAVRQGDALPLAPGTYVLIEIEDQGCGIPRENLKRIFDPYFTTKERGTGLGLATSYSIIKKHDGYIAVDSVLKAGTTFRIYLPAFHGEVVQETKPQEQDHEGTGRVLIMDDDALLLEVAGEMLKSLGYEVGTARDGVAAVQLYHQARKEGRPFAAVIMDITVPGGMGGKDAVTLLRKIDPSIKAIVSSGYSNDSILADFRSHGFSGMLVKPYQAQELGAALSAVLQGKDTSRSSTG